ncbi:hypothetical protein H5410_060407 [Solanum commersonii]|uniref:Uncharacterized protein n=1 Tax=Solanum commersonii TaxID=4109 RepID=A0A9J5W5C5_SOLCO|nr:hypothetical protein H5410_060407 [Solanum commersonii]
MATTATGSPNPKSHKPTYAGLLQPQTATKKFIPLKSIIYLHGEPKIIWEQEEIEQMIVNENIEYVIIGKVSYR